MVAFACILTAAAVAAMPAASAHAGNNHGTIKVHDDEEVSPPQRNQPKVSCDFWIEGFNMADDNGHLEFTAIPPTSNPPELVDTADWSGVEETDGRGGFHFVAGPFRLDPGHYKVEAFNDQGHPGNIGHKTKSKVFKVEPCEERVPCPTGLEAVANADGSVTLSWNAVVGADSYNVYRATGDGDFALLDNTEETSLTDDTTAVGVTYRYMVTALIGEDESENCDEVEVTAIPFFTGPVGIALASLGAVGALIGMRRRRA